MAEQQQIRKGHKANGKPKTGKSDNLDLRTPSGKKLPY